MLHGKVAVVVGAKGTVESAVAAFRDGRLTADHESEVTKLRARA